MAVTKIELLSSHTWFICTVQNVNVRNILQIHSSDKTMAENAAFSCVKRKLHILFIFMPVMVEWYHGAAYTTS